MPRVHRIEVAGERMRIPDPVCWLLNKPAGVVSTTFDPEGRPRAVDYFTGHESRVFPVGRLDVDSTGLLLMTNDGDLSNRLTHPRYGLEKTYLVEVDGSVGRDTVEGMLAGVWMSDGRAKAVRMKVIHASRTRSTVEIVLKEGRNRQIPPDVGEVRPQGPAADAGEDGAADAWKSKPGAYRRLTPAELNAVRAATEAASADIRPGFGSGGPSPAHAAGLAGRPVRAVGRRACFRPRAPHRPLSLLPRARSLVLTSKPKTEFASKPKPKSKARNADAKAQGPSPARDAGPIRVAENREAGAQERS